LGERARRETRPAAARTTGVVRIGEEIAGEETTVRTEEAAATKKLLLTKTERRHCVPLGRAAVRVTEAC
jgi:hypothetical protein